MAAVTMSLMLYRGRVEVVKGARAGTDDDPQTKECPSQPFPPPNPFGNTSVDLFKVCGDQVWNGGLEQGSFSSIPIRSGRSIFQKSHLSTSHRHFHISCPRRTEAAG